MHYSHVTAVFHSPSLFRPVLRKLEHEIRCQIFFHIQPEANNLTDALSVSALMTLFHVSYQQLRGARSYLRSLLIWKETVVVYVITMGFHCSEGNHKHPITTIGLLVDI
jgi:hypothetical protein